MRELMEQIVGQRVRVWSRAGDASYADDGVLEGIDSLWICLRSDEDERLYFPISNVRLMKVVGGS